MPFGHLSVLISIILGLGLTHLLSAFSRLVPERKRISFYWLSFLWAVLIFVSQVQWWWSSYGWRAQTEWNFFSFLYLLLTPVSMYLSAVLVLPKVKSKGHFNMKDYYFSTHQWLFLFVAAGPALDFFRRSFEDGSMADFSTWSNAVAAILVGSLILSKQVWYHALITLMVSGVYLTFIVSAALKLS